MKYTIPKWVFYRIVNDSIYITDCKNDRLLALDDTATDFWIELAKEKSVDEAISNLIEIYEVDIDALKRDYIEFAELLSSFNVILTSDKGLENSNKNINTAIQEYKTKISTDIFNDHTISVHLFEEFEKKHYLYNAALELTYKCNHKCVHCYAINQKDYDYKNELNTNQWKNILDQLYDLNTQTVILTGGEVFVRKDFMELFRYAISKRFVVTIFTNGQDLSDDDIKEIAESYPKAIHVSVFSTNPKIHDSITGIKGSYFKAIETLRKFKEYGTPINIKAQLMSYNKNELDNILDLAESLEADYQIGVSISPKNDGDTNPQKLGISDKKQLTDILSNKRFQYIKQKPENLKRNLDDRLCGAGVYGITIDPQGNYKACIAMPEILGNVKTENIADFWNNNTNLKEIVNLRMKDVENCNKCEISNICYFCMGLSWLESGTYKISNNTNCLITEAAYDSINKGFK